MAEMPMNGWSYVAPHYLEPQYACETVTVLADGRVILDGAVYERDAAAQWLAHTRSYWSALGELLRWVDSLGLVGPEPPEREG